MILGMPQIHVVWGLNAIVDINTYPYTTSKNDPQNRVVLNVPQFTI